MKNKTLSIANNSMLNFLLKLLLRRLARINKLHSTGLINCLGEIMQPGILFALKKVAYFQYEASLCLPHS
jgi:hypothetical protein